MKKKKQSVSANLIQISLFTAKFSTVSQPFLFYFNLFFFNLFHSISFYSIIFHSIFYSTLFHSILFYIFHSIQFHRLSIPFYSILFHSIQCYILFYSILFNPCLVGRWQVPEGHVRAQAHRWRSAWGARAHCQDWEHQEEPWDRGQEPYHSPWGGRGQRFDWRQEDHQQAWSQGAFLNTDTLIRA